MRDELGCDGTGCAKRGVIKCFQILPNGSWRYIWINRLRAPVRLRRGLLPVGVSGNNTSINCISLSARQSGFDALRDHRFKYMAQYIAIAEPTVTVLGKR